MRFFLLVAIMVFVTGCSKNEEAKLPGGYIQMAERGKCTLVVVQGGDLPELRIDATDCEFGASGEKRAFVDKCGRIEFVPASAMPSTDAMICSNCEILSAQSAECRMRMTNPPLLWKVD